ncbi:L,D-transpeptidase [Ammoniphilus oxalaticus]|uniref:L,D-transpeptidase n=1 Tax=Ammoniphilus oxalaticus TaxID=66863 RepID=UPI000E73CA4E|nr:L,D-transpeptidase [Ammoniphilus oxalaticus]
MRWKLINLILLVITLFSFVNGSQATEDQVHIVVSKSKHTLEIMLNNHPVYSFEVATGATPEKTPEGVYSIIKKVKNPWYLPKDIPGGDPNNPLGSRWIGIDVPNTDGYKYGIHGTNNPESIGQSVSQGCVRMQNEDVEWLFRHIPIGTKVVIQP